MAGQGAAATDRGVDVSGSRTPELVFTTALGSKMDAANVRRDLRRALALVRPVISLPARLPSASLIWTP